jgi:phage baseplate assembly protein W
VAISPKEFGADIRLLDSLQFQNDRDRGSDLLVIKRPQTGQIDLQMITDADNLKQALLLRFLTPVGEMTQLGHPDYGSRLSELIGELNDQTNRNLAKMYVLQALAQEPRVQQVLEVTVRQNTARRDEMDISVSLRAINSPTPLNLIFPFFLEGGS